MSVDRLQGQVALVGGVAGVEGKGLGVMVAVTWPLLEVEMACQPAGHVDTQNALYLLNVLNGMSEPQGSDMPWDTRWQLSSVLDGMNTIIWSVPGSICYTETSETLQSQLTIAKVGG